MKKSVLFFAAALASVAVSAQTAWSEDFQGGSMPTGWVTYEDNLTNYSQFSNYNQSWQVAQVAQGEYAAVTISYTTTETDCDRWLVTDAISVPAGDYSLTFRVYGYNPSYPEKVRVMVSTTGQQKSDFSTTLIDAVMDGTTYGAGWNDVLVDMSAYGGQDVYLAFINHGDGIYTFVDDIAIKVVEANAIALDGVSAPHNVAMGQSFDFDVTVRNMGSSNLTSFDIAYSVGGGAQQTASVTGVNVAPFAYYTHTLSATVANAGAAAISATVSNPNGVADADASDNSGSTNVTVYDPANATERTIVLEHFTTARCPNCPSGHQRLEQAVNGREDRVVWIAHHSGYYTDDMTISESETAMKYFNDGGSTYAPACMIDRSHDNATSEDPGPVFFPGSDIRTVMTNAMSRPSFVTCQITNVSYNEQTRELSATVSGQFVGDMSFDSPRVHLFLMEDSIIGAQSGGSSNYQHNHVLRACISGLDGVEEGFTTTNAGDSYSKTFTYTLPTKFRANKCWLGAFVSNQSSDVNNCEVMNGAKTGRLLDHADPTTTGITAAEASVEVKTYPNPATEMAFVSAESTIRSYQVVNAMGQVVMTAEGVNADVLELNVSGMAQGVYYISVTTDKGVATQRLTVVK